MTYCSRCHCRLIADSAGRGFYSRSPVARAKWTIVLRLNRPRLMKWAAGAGLAGEIHRFEDDDIHVPRCVRI